MTMNPTTENEEYYRRLYELQALVERAYIDIFALNEFERLNQSVKCGENTLSASVFTVFSHLCELLKQDLCLVVWKLLCDSNKTRANSISTLSNLIANKHNGIIDKHSLPKHLIIDNDLEYRINMLRNTFFAHNDVEKKHQSVSINELSSLVEEARIWLNGLVFPEIDSRVSPVSNELLTSMKYDISLELGLMIQRSAGNAAQ